LNRTYDYKNITNPCGNCTRRQLGCHGKCEDYKEWKSAMDEYNYAMKRHKHYDEEITKYEIEGHLRRKRHAKNK